MRASQHLSGGWLGRLAVPVSILALIHAAAPAAQAKKGPPFQYVTDSLKIGSTVREADSYAFGLSNDGILDNVFGRALVGMSRQIPVDATIEASISAGEAVILHSLRAKSLIRPPDGRYSTACPPLTR